MLRDLIYKELRVNVHQGLWAFLLLPALVLIPQWLYYIALMYLFIQVMVVVQTDKANNDLIFTTLLPVRKKDVVAARTCTIVGCELAYILVAAVCAVIPLRFYPQNNTISMNRPGTEQTTTRSLEACESSGMEAYYTYMFS